MKFSCAHCGKRGDKPTGEVNRATASGFSLYCNRRCAGLHRRKHKSKTQKVEEKRLYDAEYRRRNLPMLKAKKRAHHLRTYDPAKARVERKRRAHLHAEYCRQPSYKAWKRWYDAERRAGEYGNFAEAYKCLLELNREINRRISDYDTRQENHTGNKAQKRRREAALERRGRRNRDSAAYC